MFIGPYRVLLRPHPPVVPPVGPAWVDGQNGLVVNNGYSAGTKTVPNQNGGSTLPACLFFVGFMNQDGTDPVDLKVGTVAMTKAVAESSASIQLWYAAISAGETDSVTFTNGAAYTKYGVVSGWITGTISATPVSPQTATYGADASPVPLGSPCVVPSGGFGVCVGGTHNIVGADSSPTWTNNVGSVIEGYLSAIGRVGLVHTNVSGNWSPTLAPVSFAAGLAAAAWGP